MKKVYSLLLVLLLPCSAFAENAMVALYNPQCRDYFIAQSKDGYIFAQWYGGYEPKQGDIISGELNTPGLKSVTYSNFSEIEKIVVLDYALSKSEVLDRYIARCKGGK